MNKKAIIIVNPVAGKMKAKSILLDLISNLEDQDYESTVYITKHRGDGSTAAERYGRVSDLVVCCGGDGTLNEVITGLLRLEERPPLLYYPCGSTNDFAATLGLSSDINEATKDIENRQILNLDIGNLNGERNFSYITSFGIFTKASFSAKQSVKNSLGHFAYILEGIKEIPTLGRSYHTKITYDDGVIEGNYALVAVTNSTSAGGVLKLPSEIVKLNDGLFEILLVKSLANIVDATNVISMLAKQKYDGDNIVMVQATRAVIECDGTPEWCTDGEFAGILNRAEVICNKGAIKLII